MDKPWQGRKLHFVGIGGAGMSGIAQIAVQLGADVSGSDQAQSSYTDRLVEAGVRISFKHDAAAVPDGCEVIYSTAIAESNPELELARERGYRQLHRADLLGELTNLKATVAVAGTHGKTTTSSMIVHALQRLGCKPSYVVGGEIQTTATNADWQDGQWLIVEADESDRSLLKLNPKVAVLTNLELDHHTTYSDFSDLKATVESFLAPTESVVIQQDQGLETVVPKTAKLHQVAVGSYHTERFGSQFELRQDPELHSPVSVTLSVPGKHNATNAACALLACQLAGADIAEAAATLKDFKGAGRRFELIGKSRQLADIYDDYAHHPTEVAAALTAAKALPYGRVITLFQPHLYSRTAALWEQFAEALTLADELLITEIYPARESAQDWPNVSAKMIADRVDQIVGKKHVRWVPQLEQAQQLIEQIATKEDLIITLGAGNVNGVAYQLAGR